jgi:hypothetical protein
MGTLSKETVQGINEFIECDVFQDIDGHRLDQSKGVIQVACGDGDQFPDIYRHHRKICRENHGHERVHPITLDGGALLLSERSPLLVAGLPEDKVILHNIADAFMLKGFPTVALYAHAPCGRGSKAGVDIYQAAQLLIEGKARVKNTFPDKFKVACFFHVAYNNGKKRTYFVSRNAWLDWAKFTT